MAHVGRHQYPQYMDQVRSRQRVIDHGEVFTPRWMVDAMLDLVKDESERIDSRFLEPACGELTSRSRVTASNTGFLVGFAPLLNHVSRVHAVARGALVAMRFSVDSMKVRPDFSKSVQ